MLEYFIQHLQSADFDDMYIYMIIHLAGSDNDPAGLNAEVVEAIRQGSYRLRPVVQRRIDRRDQKR